MITETAFAKQVDSSTCFLDITDLSVLKKKGKKQTLETAKFDRWGWTNMCVTDDEGLYLETLPMYAGAAQCDICRGAFVGNVTIDYSGGGNLTVRYSVFDVFFLNEVHIHVDGRDKVPFVGSSYTVAPGQYGCGTHTDDACSVSVNNTDYVFEATFTDVPATFYVIAHAVVAGSSLTFSNNTVSC
jgi:hypothetical protein